jgi:hypothetical protein
MFEHAKSGFARVSDMVAGQKMLRHAQVTAPRRTREAPPAMTSRTVGMTRRTSACGRRSSPRPLRFNLGASNRAATTLRYGLFLAADFRFLHGGPGLHGVWRGSGVPSSSSPICSSRSGSVTRIGKSRSSSSSANAISRRICCRVLVRQPDVPRSPGRRHREHTLAENGEQISGLEPDQLAGESRFPSFQRRRFPRLPLWQPEPDSSRPDIPCSAAKVRLLRPCRRPLRHFSGPDPAVSTFYSVNEMPGHDRCKCKLFEVKISGFLGYFGSA